MQFMAQTGERQDWLSLGLKIWVQVLEKSVVMLEEIPIMFTKKWKNPLKNVNNIWKWCAKEDATMSKKLNNQPNSIIVITDQPTPLNHLRRDEGDHHTNGDVASRKKILLWWLKEEKEGDLDSMPYKETCNLCKGNGYITIVVEGKDEIKQCWLCESKGEKEYSQAEVDDLIYKTYYKK